MTRARSGERWLPGSRSEEANQEEGLGENRVVLTRAKENKYIIKVIETRKEKASRKERNEMLGEINREHIFKDKLSCYGF